MILLFLREFIWCVFLLFTPLLRSFTPSDPSAQRSKLCRVPVVGRVHLGCPARVVDLPDLGAVCDQVLSAGQVPVVGRVHQGCQAPIVDVPDFGAVCDQVLYAGRCPW